MRMRMKMRMPMTMRMSMTIKNKKQKILASNKACISIVKNAKNIQVIHFQKN